MNTCCDVRDRIVHMDCEYRDGKFHMQYLPGCLPTVFTARFKAPADFSEGDTIVVKDVEMLVMTSQMEAAEAGIFKSGAMMMCEIDLDRKLAFIRTGGNSCDCEDVEFQTSDLVYYIDPLGDDSPNNTGTLDSPFRTLAGAGRVAWENIVMNPLGRLVFSFNPGTYDLSVADRTVLIEATHPLGILYKATDLANKPLIRANEFIPRNGRRVFEGLRLHSINPHNPHSVTPYENATLFLTDSEVIINKPKVYAFGPHCGGTLRIWGSLKVDGNGYSPHSIFFCHQGTLWANNANITLENFASVESATVYVDSGHVYLGGATFSGAITGRRYYACANGVIHTSHAGNDFIPGTVAGSTSTGGLYI